MAKEVSVEFSQILAEAGAEEIEPFSRGGLGSHGDFTNELKVFDEVFGAGLDQEMGEPPRLRVAVGHGFPVSQSVIVGKKEGKRIGGSERDILNEIVVVVLIDLPDSSPSSFAGQVRGFEIGRQSFAQPKRASSKSSLQSAIESDLVAGFVDDGSDGPFRFWAGQDLLHQYIAIDSHIAGKHSLDTGQVIRGKTVRTLVVIAECILRALKFLARIADVIRFGFEDERNQWKAGRRELETFGFPEAMESAVESFVQIDIPSRVGFRCVVAKEEVIAVEDAAVRGHPTQHLLSQFDRFGGFEQTGLGFFGHQFLWRYRGECSIGIEDQEPEAIPFRHQFSLNRFGFSVLAVPDRGHEAQVRDGGVC